MYFILMPVISLV